MSKSYYATKNDLESFGCKVITGVGPVTLLNDQPLAAKVYKFESLEQLKNSDLIKDVKAFNSYIYMYEMSKEQLDDLNKLQENFSNYQDAIVFNSDDADKVIIRLYNAN
jgi:hypothetical protein